MSLAGDSDSKAAKTPTQVNGLSPVRLIESYEPLIPRRQAWHDPIVDHATRIVDDADASVSARQERLILNGLRRPRSQHANLSPCPDSEQPSTAWSIVVVWLPGPPTQEYRRRHRH